jgi:CDP-diacylglycerol--glycerol-3-phosphate 3-phosphatidyltransferase
MVVVTLFGIIGAFLTSYTRARAEALGIDAKVGMLQRPERVTLLSAPQAFFGLALDGFVLMGIVTLLTVTAWITAIQRIRFVHQATHQRDAQAAEAVRSTETAPHANRGGSSRPVLRVQGE